MYRKNNSRVIEMTQIIMIDKSSLEHLIEQGWVFTDRVKLILRKSLTDIEKKQIEELVKSKEKMIRYCAEKH